MEEPFINILFKNNNEQVRFGDTPFYAFTRALRKKQKIIQIFESIATGHVTVTTALTCSTADHTKQSATLTQNNHGFPSFLFLLLS